MGEINLKSIDKIEELISDFKVYYKAYKNEKIVFRSSETAEGKNRFRQEMENCFIYFIEFKNYLVEHAELIDDILDKDIFERLNTILIYHLHKLKDEKLDSVVGDQNLPGNILGWLADCRAFTENYINQQLSAKKLIDAEVNALRGKIENYTAMQIFEGNLEAYNVYNDSAKKNRTIANYFDAFFILILISAASFSYFSFETLTFQLYVEKISLIALVLIIFSKLFLASILIAICTFLLKRSSQHRKLAHIESTRALELKAMGPYLKGMSDEKIEEVKLSLITSYFGKTSLENEDFHINEALLNNLKATSDVLKTTAEAAKVVSDVGKNKIN